MRYLAFIIMLICLFSCKETQKEKVNHLVNEWTGRRIQYPDTVHFTSLGIDTSFFRKSEYKIISYVDSVGCTSCKLRLAQWKIFISQLDSIGNISILFFISQKSQRVNLYFETE